MAKTVPPPPFINKTIPEPTNTAISQASPALPPELQARFFNWLATQHQATGAGTAPEPPESPPETRTALVPWVAPPSAPSPTSGPYKSPVNQAWTPANTPSPEIAAVQGIPQKIPGVSPQNYTPIPHNKDWSVEPAAPPPSEARKQFEKFTISEEHGELYEQAKQGKKRLIGRKDEELFVREYIRTGRNLDLAMKRLGLPPSLGPKFIRRRGVQQALRLYASVGLEAMDVTTDRVLLQLGRIAMWDPRQMVDETGHPKPIHELSEDIAMSIEQVAPNGAYKMASRTDALRQIAAVLGMNKSTQNINVTQTVNSQLEMMPIEQLAQMLNIATGTKEPEIIDAECTEVEE